MSKRVTIIVPVYGDWPSLKKCIESLKLYTNEATQILFINDCGPDVENIENNLKDAIKNTPNFKYFRNPKNLGFVATCNRAVLELDKTNNDILFLNSDTKVTKGFLEAMSGILARNSKIGVVSPRSNNATLATVPLWSAVQKGVGQSQSLAIYQKIQPHLPEFYLAPVGHGFCMLIRRSLIEKYGLFDEVFGRGYGEEVDFCMRLARHGYKSAIANHAYVFHLEARSFSLEAKAKLLEAHNKIIWQRYPDYRQLVKDYMQKTIDQEKQIESDLGIKRPNNKLRKLTRFLKTKLA